MMKGWACCVLICHQQKRTFGGWRTSSRDFAYFRVLYDILRSSWKRSSPCVPTTVVVLKQPSPSIHTIGRHRRFVGDSAFQTPLRGAPLLVGEQQKWYHQILQKVQNLMPHDDYIPSCTVLYILLYSSTHLLITVVFI